MSIRLLSALIVSLLLSACGGTNIQQYSQNKPVMDLRFFTGDLTAHGIVKDRSGDVIRYFNATLNGTWDNNGVGVLKEDFVFNDGEKQYREWTFTPQKDGSYIATANDVVGNAYPKTSGNALFMNYTLQIQYKGKPMEIKIDDRMYRTNERVVINESTMKKFGFNVGSFTLVIEKSK